MSNKFRLLDTHNFAPATLDEAPVGCTCAIVRCTLPQTLKLRLEEMGLTAGTTVTVLKIAPLGDPMQICVRGYSICIRKDTAKGFVVKATRAN